MEPLFEFSPKAGKGSLTPDWSILEHNPVLQPSPPPEETLPELNTDGVWQQIKDDADALDMLENGMNELERMDMQLQLTDNDFDDIGEDSDSWADAGGDPNDSGFDADSDGDFGDVDI